MKIKKILNDIKFLKPFMVIVISVAVVLAIILLFFYYYNYKAELKLIEARERNTVDLGVSTIIIDFKSIVSDLMILSDSIETHQGIFAGNEESIGDLASDFLSFSTRKQSYDQIRYLNILGQEEIRINFNENSPKIVPNHKLQNKGNRYYFKDAIGINQNEIFVSPLDLNIEQGVIERPKQQEMTDKKFIFKSIWRVGKAGQFVKPMIRFATPVFNRNFQKMGLVLINVFGSPLLNRIEKTLEYSFGHGLFINSSGYWIKGFTPEQEWGFMDKNQTVENAKFQDMFPDAWKIVNTKNYGQLYTEKGLFTFQDVSPLRNDQIPEKDILEGTESTIKQDKNKLTWKVVTFVSADVLREVQRKPIAVYLVIYISCLILLAAIVWGWRTRQKHEYTRKQYGTLLKVISQPIFTINLDGVFLFLNAVFSDQLSGSPSDFIGKNLWDVFAEDEASNLLSDLREASTKRLLLLLSKELTINNGKTRWYNVRVQPYSEKKDIYDKILVILTDITKQKQAEEALRESQHRLATHIELTPIGVIEFNRNYEVYSWNPAAKSIFGYTEEETKSRNLIDLVIPEYEIERVTKIYQLETSELIGSYIDNKTKDGRIITCQWFNTPLFNRAGKLVGTAAVCQDVTDQLKAEKVLRDSKEVLESAVRKRTKELEEATKLAESANRAKTEFLENMSHELRTPMHGILSFSKFGIEKFDKTSKEKKLGYFKTINQSGKRLMYLLDNLLDLSKLEAEKEVFKMQSVNIGQLINNAVIETETISQEKKMKVVVKEPLVPSKNICDVYKIGQVISNLLDNALKFTPENRQITISYDSGPLVSQRWLTNKETMSATIVSVKDEGVGVPNGELESIFDKFIQSSKTKTGAGGTGLGLAICKEIIKAHKGIIWAENNLDGGSIFSFVLPCELEIVPEHIND